MTAPKRTDANQGEIVDALRAVGATVTSTHMIGGGFPDLYVGYRGDNYLLEVKDGSKPPSRRKLTPDEEKWHSECQGYVEIVNDANEALYIIGATRFCACVEPELYRLKGKLTCATCMVPIGERDEM